MADQGWSHGGGTALERILSSMWQSPQMLAGLAYGTYKTGKLPRIENDPEGRTEYRYDVEGEDPLSVGPVIIGPKNIRPDHLFHERVHSGQSRRFGPAYIPARVLGDLMSRFDTGDPYIGHPMEDEAYIDTRNESPEARQALIDYLSMKQGLRNRK